MTISQNHLKRMLDYNPDTGLFVWKIAPKYKPSFKGKIAGCYYKTKRTDGTGCRGVIFRIKGKNYFGHHLAWLYMYGVMPKEIDHINRDYFDNRIGNLRECTRSQNMCNRVGKKNSIVGVKGVYYQHGGYFSSIGIGYKQIYLGRFKTIAEAKAAYDAAAKKYHGEFARAS